MKTSLAFSAFALLLVLVAAGTSGCGSSSGSAVSAPQQSRDSTLQLVLDRDQIPDGVTELEVIGLDADGRRLWERTFPSMDSLEVEGAPVGTQDVVVAYLRNRKAVALSVLPLSARAETARSLDLSSVTPLSEAISDLTLNNTDVEIPNQTVVLLKLGGTLPQGQTLELGREAVWVSTNPQVATVERGLVRGRSEGVTTIRAQIGNLSAETQLTVTAQVDPQDLPDIVLDNTTAPGRTLDLNAGTLDGAPLPGWNPTNRTWNLNSLAIDADVVDVVGDDWVTSCNNLSIGGGFPAIDSYLYSEAVSFPGSLGFAANEGVSRGGNLTVITPSSLNVGDLECPGFGPGGRGGDIRLEAGGDVSVVGIEVTGAIASNNVSGSPGDIHIRGESVTVNGELLAACFSPRLGRGPDGGRISIVGESGITIGSDCDLDVAGADGSAALGGRRGGSGGSISLISQGPITTQSRLKAEGGNSYGVTPGGDGGTIRVFSPGQIVIPEADAQGGFGRDKGGDGGTIVLSSNEGGSTNVAAGSGLTPGNTGTVTILGGGLDIDSGTHRFDIDTGRFDGIVLGGWDPVTQTLNLTSFALEEGATLELSGSGLFSCSSSGAVEIAGTMTFPGMSAGSPDIATPGGPMYIASKTAITVASSGLLSSDGGDSDETAGGGGFIRLSGPIVEMDGHIQTSGGQSSNSSSGSGGIVVIDSAGSVTMNGLIDCSGRDGFNHSGSGGLIGILCQGDLQSPGQLLCAAGETALRAGTGGTVLVAVAGTTNLSEVNCNGADSGLQPGTGGIFRLLGQDDITLDGPISANSGSSANIGGMGGTIDVDGRSLVHVTSSGSVRANGNTRGQGGSVTINGDAGVTTDGPVTATPRGTVTITP